jgi:hypothetical protein
MTFTRLNTAAFSRIYFGNCRQINVREQFALLATAEIGMRE